jgi:hypothetical protein
MIDISKLHPVHQETIKTISNLKQAGYPFTDQAIQNIYDLVLPLAKKQKKDWTAEARRQVALHKRV